MSHANELAGRRVRLTILDESEPSKPNQAMLDALEKIARRNSGKRFTSGEDTQRLLREARAGKMFGDDSDK